MLSSTFFHKRWDLATAFPLADKKRLQVACDRLIQQRVFRLARSILSCAIRHGFNTQMIRSPHDQGEAASAPLAGSTQRVKTRMLAVKSVREIRSSSDYLSPLSRQWRLLLNADQTSCV
jgi:hypothetical protein